MTVLRVVFASRMVVPWLALLLVAAVPVRLLGRNGFAIGFDSMKPSVTLVFPVVITIVLVSIGAFLLRPRMWELDRIGSSRAVLVVLTMGVASLAGPLALLAWSTRAIPHGDPVSWVITDGCFFGALVLVLSPFASPLGSGVCSTMLYVATGLGVYMSPRLQDLLPAGGDVMHRPHWLWATLVVVLSLAAQALTRGSSARVRRLFDKDR